MLVLTPTSVDVYERDKKEGIKSIKKFQFFLVMSYREDGYGSAERGSSNGEDSSPMEQFSYLLDRVYGSRSSASLEALSSFLQNRTDLNAVLQAWSYASTSNNYTALVSLSNNLTRLLSLDSEQLYEPSKFAADFTIENMAVFYRCIYGRSKVANPAFDLMRAVVEFHEGDSAESFLEKFDVTLPMIPKLAIPTKSELAEPVTCQDSSSIRHHFVHFWLSFLANVGPLARQDIMKTKVMGIIFKYVGLYDDEELQRRLIQFIDNSILMEQDYKRMTKCRLIGDWGMTKLVDLYAVDSLRDELQSLMLKMCTDSVNGLVFHDDKCWFTTSAREGAAVEVNSKTYHIYNKLIYTLLTNLKPWADDKQVDLVVATISKLPELLPVYCNHCLFINGANDTKLSSFYIGQSLMLKRLIDLPVPDTFIKILHSRIRRDIYRSSTISSSELPSSNLIEAICPRQLTRSVLSQGLLSKYQLIRHINSSLIISVFKKYRAMIKVLSDPLFKKLRQELKDTVAQRLPDLGAIIGALNECTKEPDNKLLLINHLRMAEDYHEVFGQTGTIHLSMDFEKDDFKGPDLIILDLYLQLTCDSPEQNKWWNASKGNSLFTSLLLMPSWLAKKGLEDGSIVNKVTEVLANLVTDTLIFADFRRADQTVLESQIYALLYASRDINEGIAHVIDESVARCVKSPYKYIDTAAKHSKFLSPFFFTVLEQSKFYKGDPKQLQNWLQLFGGYLAALGEPESEIQEALQLPLTTGTREDSVFETVLNAPTATLGRKLSSIHLLSDIDAVALICRGRKLIREGAPKAIKLSLMSLLGNYMIQKYESSIDGTTTVNSVNLLTKKYWEHFYADSYTAGLLNEIFYTIYQGHGDRAPFENFQSVVLQQIESGSTEPVLKLSLWVLTDEQIVALLGKSTPVESSLLEAVVARDIALPSDSFVELTKTSDSPLLGKVAKKVALTADDVDSILNKFREAIYPVIEAISTQFAEQIAEFVQPRAQEIASTASGLNLLCSLSYPELTPITTRIASSGIEEIISDGAISNRPVLVYLRILQNDDNVLKLLDIDEFSNDASLVFSPEFVHCLVGVSNSSWYYRATLYITKMFSETVDELPVQFRDFISSLQVLSDWKSVPMSMLTSQLEMILSRKWVQDVQVLKYVLSLLISCSQHVDGVRVFQIFVNNELNPLNGAEYLPRYYSALVAYYLFKANAKQLSTDYVQRTIVKEHRATIRSDDRILREILEEIEYNLGVNWVNYVSSWEFNDDPDISEPFASETAQGIKVTISEDILEKTLDQAKTKSATSIQCTTLTEWEALEKDEGEVYDGQFILLVAISNEELFKTEDNKIVVNIGEFAASGLLQLVVANLASTDRPTVQVARKIVETIVVNLNEQIEESEKRKKDREESKEDPRSKHRPRESRPEPQRFLYRERNLLKVFLSDILYTLASENIPSITMLMLSRLVPVVTNPSHLMYEKSFQYMLRGPKVKPLELPLYRSVMLQFVKDPKDVDDIGGYYKRLAWFLRSLEKTITCGSDLEVLDNASFFESLYSLTTSPYLDLALQSTIVNILLRVVELPGGVDVLVMNAGLLGFLESRCGQLSAGQRKKLNMNEACQNLLLLEYQRMALETGIVSSKRTREWTGDQLDRSVKRMLI